MASKLVLLMYESWAQLDRSMSGMTPGEMTTRYDGGSNVVWTVGHVTNMVDSWINVRFQGLSPHPVISQADFRTGGSGEAKDWPNISAAVSEVRDAARWFLDSKTDSDLDILIPYDGSIAFLRPIGLRLSYAIMRIAAHHFQHAGEIVTIRSRLGHEIDGSSEWGKALV